MKNNKTLISARSRLYTSVLLVLLALVAVTAATVAWFSIADNTKVKSMSLDIVSGTDLRIVCKNTVFRPDCRTNPAGKRFLHAGNPAGTGDNAG